MNLTFAKCCSSRNRPTPPHPCTTLPALRKGAGPERGLTIRQAQSALSMPLCHSDQYGH